ncbi:hypothetical protein GGR52DRAFT_568317 [Hypoxylon sp. FL1284]|nr:hypothetical protein GGR52DRAFT_568317 [Hypoxylon sp. FL1284]
MQHKAVTAAGVMAAYSLMQSCPAPVAAFIPLIGEVAGTVAGAAVHWFGRKRDFSSGKDFTFEAELAVPGASGLHARASCMTTPSGVPENVIQDCCDALNGAQITVNGYEGDKKITITGIPYPCISAAPWFDGTGTVPYACGDDCLEYAGLSGDEFNQLRAKFESL